MGGAALTWISPKASLSVRLSAAYTCSKDVSNCPPIVLLFLFSPVQCAHTILPVVANVLLFKVFKD